MAGAPLKLTPQGLAIPPAPFHLQPLQTTATPQINPRQRQGTGQGLLLAHGSHPIGISVCVQAEEIKGFGGRPCGRPPKQREVVLQGFWGARIT